MKRSICGVLMLILAGCAQSGSETATTTEAGTVATETATETAATTTDQASTAAEETSMTQYENKVAEIHTSAGQVNIRFFPGEAPGHVKNFIDLAQKGFYNGTKFHRVIPGFMVQGGDPNTISGDPNSWGTGGNGGNYLKAEFNSISHKRGIVSMARAQSPDSASSQFFICVADSPFLDKQYSVFGQVTQGMDVVDKIVSAPRGANDRPNSPTSIEKIVIRDAAAGETGPAPK